MPRELTWTIIQDVLKNHSLVLWDALQIDEACIGLPLGEDHPCIQVSVRQGEETKVPAEVIVITAEWGMITIPLKVVPDYETSIPLED